MIWKVEWGKYATECDLIFLSFSFPLERKVGQQSGQEIFWEELTQPSPTNRLLLMVNWDSFQVHIKNAIEVMHNCAGLVRILSQYRIPLQSKFLAYFLFWRIKVLQDNRALSLRICMSGGVSLLSFELMDRFSRNLVWISCHWNNSNFVDFNFIQWRSHEL
jgi:hypothetical protein